MIRNIFIVKSDEEIVYPDLSTYFSHNENKLYEMSCHLLENIHLIGNCIPDTKGCFSPILISILTSL